MKHFRLKIRGKVQGVFFRASTRNEAILYDIKGIVRNEHDGTVYIECEGDEENLRKFINWCYQGPPASEVEDIEIEEGSLKGYNSFKIAH